MLADTLTAVAVYTGAMAGLAAVAYYLRWDRHD
jgi:hypothetical protein